MSNKTPRLIPRRIEHLSQLLDTQEVSLSPEDRKACHDLRRYYNEAITQCARQDTLLIRGPPLSEEASDCFYHSLRLIGENVRRVQRNVFEVLPKTKSDLK